MRPEQIADLVGLLRQKEKDDGIAEKIFNLINQSDQLRPIFDRLGTDTDKDKINVGEGCNESSVTTSATLLLPLDRWSSSRTARTTSSSMSSSEGR